MPHGFRSSFRDWAAEKTDHPREVIEAALAHVVQNKVEAAYARSDLFERRRRLMDDWAAYLAAKVEPGSLGVHFSMLEGSAGAGSWSCATTTEGAMQAVGAEPNDGPVAPRRAGPLLARAGSSGRLQRCSWLKPSRSGPKVFCQPAPCILRLRGTERTGDP